VKTLEKRLRRIEERLAARIVAKQALNATQVLIERIQGMAARMRAGGYEVAETGPQTDAVRLDIEQRLAHLLDSYAR